MNIPKNSRDCVLTDDAIKDLAYFRKKDPKKVEKILKLIEEIKQNPFKGTGKPEALKYGYTGYWSRRIDNTNRLVYKVENNVISIASARFHYDK